MDLVWMDLGTVSGAAAIALIGTALYAGIAIFSQALARSLARARHFSYCIMSEAAQRFRGEHELATRKQAILLSSGLENAEA